MGCLSGPVWQMRIASGRYGHMTIETMLLAGSSQAQLQALACPHQHSANQVWINLDDRRPK